MPTHKRLLPLTVLGTFVNAGGFVYYALKKVPWVILTILALAVAICFLYSLLIYGRQPGVVRDDEAKLRGLRALKELIMLLALAFGLLAIFHPDAWKAW